MLTLRKQIFFPNAKGSVVVIENWYGMNICQCEVFIAEWKNSVAFSIQMLIAIFHYYAPNKNRYRKWKTIKSEVNQGKR